MKAVLLARGLGSRMKQEDAAASLTASQAAAAAAGSKAFLPIGYSEAETGNQNPKPNPNPNRARPFLDYVLSALADAGCHSVCIIVAPDHTAMREYYEGPGKPSRLRIEFAIQPVADGTARAVLSGERYAGDDPFLVLNSDNLYPADVLRTLAGLDGPGLPAYERDALIRESGFPAERVASFAALEVDDRGDLIRIIEKPGRQYFDAAGPRALVSMNLWRFDRRIFNACRDVPLSARGEYELPEAVGVAIERGVKFRTFRAGGGVLDLSRRGDVPLVSARLAGVEPHP